MAMFMSCMLLFKQAYDSINGYKLFEVMNYYEVNKIGMSNNGRGKKHLSRYGMICQTTLKLTRD